MNNLRFRKALKSDSELYFKWVNDPLVREQSYNSNTVTWDEHQSWFLEKIYHPDWHFYLFVNLENQYVGQVRIQTIDLSNAVIGVSVDANYRGMGCGLNILQLAIFDFLNSFPNILINIKRNINSKIICI